MGEVSTNDGDGDDDNGGFNKTATVITSCLRLCFSFFLIIPPKIKIISFYWIG